MHSTTLASDNILIPNGTFVVELVAFALVLLVLWRFVLPPVRKAVTDRQELIAAQLAEGHRAAEQLKKTELEYQQALAEARTTAASIRDEARAEAGTERDRIIGEANEERSALLATGREQLTGDNEVMVRQLRADLGPTAVELSGRILGEPLVEEAARRGTVERFLAELEPNTGQAPASTGGRR